MMQGDKDRGPSFTGDLGSLGQLHGCTAFADQKRRGESGAMQRLGYIASESEIILKFVDPSRTGGTGSGPVMTDIQRDSLGCRLACRWFRPGGRE